MGATRALPWADQWAEWAGFGCPESAQWAKIKYVDFPHVGDFRIESDYSKLNARYPIPQNSDPSIWFRA
jgi:hypothetical protein